ncbi:MAG: tRNA 2-thiouridine(34) synthase MnmA [Candidatus Paceibacterota bacterium]|jgi:tRNA-specific 2-thiouridylase
MKQKVFVGVSGGVDSSVSAALLKDAGYNVTGVFIKTWSPDFLPCTWKEERRDAMRVCAALNIPFLTLDCEKEYKEGVADYMIAEYKVGRTPNPDVMCNKEVKFGVFLRKALEMGADFVATGHYVQVAAQREKGNSTNTYSLSEAVDKNKDQSYFLWTLTQSQLAHILFPVGHLTKPEVRKLAKKYNLPTALKKDSQGICFVGKVDMADFLKHFIDIKPGVVLNTEGDHIGTHDGAVFYTIGQRHGFTVDAQKNDAQSYYCIAKDIEKNTLTVSHSPHTENPNTKTVRLGNVNIIRGDIKELLLSKTLSCRVRYRQPLLPCTLSEVSGTLQVTFSEPSLVAAGQSVVIYGDETKGCKEMLLGGVVM